MYLSALHVSSPWHSGVLLDEQRKLARLVASYTVPSPAELNVWDKRLQACGVILHVVDVHAKYLCGLLRRKELLQWPNG